RNATDIAGFRSCHVSASRLDELQLGRHLSTLLGTAVAGLGAAAAVVGRVLGAFGVACLGADAADGGGQRRTPAHESGTDPAQLGAVPAGSDAVGHFRMGDA